MHVKRCYTLPGCNVCAMAAPLPFSTSTSVDASLHIMRWGGRQSSCFTSTIVSLAGASTTNAHVPSPRELRTVTLVASGETTGRVLLAMVEGDCIQQLQFQAQRGRGNAEHQKCEKEMLDLDEDRCLIKRWRRRCGGAAKAAALQVKILN
jgi:hypothetical protein